MKVQLVSFGNNQNPYLNKIYSREEMEKRVLNKLLEQYKEKPFKYAVVSYSNMAAPKVTIYPKNKPAFSKLKSVLKKIIKK